jgi:hypothetical protein
LGRSGQSARAGDAPLYASRSITAYSDEKTIDALVKIAIKGKSKSARVSAAIALLDRGFGKATQPVESDVNLVNCGISAVPMTSEEWQAQFCTEEIKGEFSH